MKKEPTTAVPCTREQFVTLLKAVYLGNYVANGYRTGRKGDPHEKTYEALTDYLFSLAPQFGLPANMERELEEGMLEGKSEVINLLQDFEEESFWDELCDRLGERDFDRMYTAEQRVRMSADERFEKRMECVIAWEAETEEHGLERITVNLKKLGV